jgi:hypothetical protein
MERSMARRTDKDQAAGNESQQPYMPGEAAKRRGEIPTGESRNKDYGKGRQSGVVADRSKPEADKSEHEKAQEAELEMNERNH